MKIFISYRRGDTAGHAGRLYDSLRARFGPDSVFMDLSGIESGQDFIQAIDHAIRRCDALVAVIGDTWLTCADADGRRLDDPGDFVRSEIAAALERGIPVIPVLVEGARMPSADALPDVLKPLAQRQANELSDGRWAYDVERLVRALEKLGGKPPAAQRRWIAVAAAAAIIALAAAVFLRRDIGQEPPGGTSTDVSAPQVTAAATPASSTPAGAGAPASAPVAAVAGEWTAEVTYPWGASYTERFSFKLDGDEVLGTASFLRTPRGIVSGTIEGDRLQFHTVTQEVLGDWNKPDDVTHRYRGRISGDAITFYMQSEGGSSTVPVEFTAHRVGSGSAESAPRP